MVQDGPAGAFKQICPAPHICSYVLSRNMRSMLPIDGSNPFKVGRFWR
jgi:hypothetical protein